MTNGEAKRSADLAELPRITELSRLPIRRRRAENALHTEGPADPTQR
jgi:hypothetical protein